MRGADTCYGGYFAGHTDSAGSWFLPPFLYKLVPVVIDIMGQGFPEVLQRKDYCEQVIQSEEERFGQTLEQGIEKFSEMIDAHKKTGKSVLSGNDVFALYDTYGFPDRTLPVSWPRKKALPSMNGHMPRSWIRKKSADARPLKKATPCYSPPMGGPESPGFRDAVRWIRP